jgi:fructose-specific phosphotransferase system IIC component
MSVMRQSFWYAVMAALAANGSLWYWLYTREGFGLVEHPQLWLIPPALCALAAGYINRRRLTAQESAALRYAAAIVIYASSTADVFINGVANAPWLPAVLAGLSILGVLAGILLRVRAFLYLGTTFLVVALLTVIWHAAIHERQTWILWVAGIITGALIIAMFGLFEKRRDDVLRVVEQLKQWEA